MRWDHPQTSLHPSPPIPGKTVFHEPVCAMCGLSRSVNSDSLQPDGL